MAANSERALEVLAAASLVGLLFSASSAYRNAAPDLQDIRDANPGDPIMSSRLMDADISIGVPVVVAGFIAAWMLKSWLPLGVLAIVLVATSGYHHGLLGQSARHYN